jgi:NitT/TauT family transport system substrate-binding protein
MKSARKLSMLAMLLGIAVPAAQPADAEPATLRHGYQPGLPHLPALVMKNQKLLEACLTEQGLGSTHVEWYELAGAAQTDGLLSGNLDFGSSGVTNLATMWAATHGKVKAIASADAVPNDLVTTNPKVVNVKDFGPDDRISVPSVKVSPQAIMLQMAAEDAFGDYRRLDSLTVSMRHEDAAVALLSGSGAVTSHFSAPPFQEQELADPKIHRVASSYDILGGPATVTVMTSTTRFHDANPLSAKAERCAVERAIKLINSDSEATAKIYLEESGDTKTQPDAIVKILKDPRMLYATVPLNIMKFVNFMHKIGELKAVPDSWKDLFFPEGQSEGGS